MDTISASRSRRWRVRLGVIAAFVLYGLVSLGLPALFGWPWRLPMPGLAGLLAGLPLVLAGMALQRLSWRALGGARALGGELFRDGSESRLICNGVYGRIRHPLYVAAMALLVGLTLLVRLTPLAVLSALFLVHFVVVAAGEERELRRRFGAAYDAYRARVPAVLPRRSRRR